MSSMTEFNLMFPYKNYVTFCEHNGKSPFSIIMKKLNQFELFEFTKPSGIEVPKTPEFIAMGEYFGMYDAKLNTRCGQGREIKLN